MKGKSLPLINPAHLKAEEPPLKLALIEALKKDDTQLFEMGSNGRRLVETNYSMQSVAQQMLELCNWLLQKAMSVFDHNSTCKAHQ